MTIGAKIDHRPKFFDWMPERIPEGLAYTSIFGLPLRLLVTDKDPPKTYRNRVNQIRICIKGFIQWRERYRKIATNSQGPFN